MASSNDASVSSELKILIAPFTSLSASLASTLLSICDGLNLCFAVGFGSSNVDDISFIEATKDFSVRSGTRRAL